MRAGLQRDDAIAATSRIEGLKWERISKELDAHGNAVLDGLLSRDECRTVAELYGQERPFRSRVVMASHGFGRGEYKYFSYPLPELIAELRQALYAYLAPVANRWN